MIDHPVRARVAEIIVARGMENTRGSGYLVSSSWVLTACHVVHDAVSIGVWLGASSELTPEASVAVDVGRVLMIPAADLALVPVDRHVNDPSCEPVLFGRLDRDAGPPVPVAAAGCPRFKLRPNPAHPNIQLRDVMYAIGTIAGLSDVKTHMYAFAVDVVPSTDPEPDKHSPWEGMSGAAIWGNGRLIGVVGQHHPLEGLSTLTVRPIEQLFNYGSATELNTWRAALPQLPPSAERLWLVTPRAARKIEVAGARRAVERSAPKVLIGRSAELAALNTFTRSGARWRWLQGDAFAGKTALLAWFALHPSDQVDIVACFLRPVGGDNTAEYALGMLTRQLALLADRRDYVPSTFMSERANDFIDLLEEAARACAERDRRLLVLIDGLDEYDAASTNFDLADWLPGQNTLPNEAMLLVASRAGADVRLPEAHPLFGHVCGIMPSDAAFEIRDAARAELDRAVRTPSGFVFRLVSCLAVADAGLTSGELRILLKRRGHDADISEIEALLGSSLGRSLMRVPDLDDVGTQVHVFAHVTLLREARLRFAADLATYEDLFDAWADEYAERDWPIDIPQYLLRPYTRELARRARDPATPSLRCRAALNQLFKVVAHRSRLHRLFERTGNPAVPDREIVAAQQAIIDSRERSGLDPDETIFRLAVLALRRRPLTYARADIAARIAAVWACIGRVNSAVDLAAGIDDPTWRAEALGEVAVALAKAGQAGQAADAAGQALRAAARVAQPERWAEVLGEVAVALAKAGQAGQAADVAGQALRAAAAIADPERRAEVLGEVAVALAEGGQAGQAADVAGQALQAAAAIGHPMWRAEVLGEVAVALAKAGQAAQAVQAAADVTHPGQRAWVLSEVAVALAEAGQAAQALQAAAAIADRGRRARVLGEVAVALAKAGQAGQPADAAGQALRAAAAIADRGQRDGVLGEVAVALAEAGQAAQALQAAAAIADRGQRAQMLSETAAALAKAGQAAQALQAAAAIAHPEQRARALGALLSASAVQSSSDGEVGRRALELLLLTSNAPDYLAAFPVALLRRLVVNRELEPAERPSADPSAL